MSLFVGIIAADADKAVLRLADRHAVKMVRDWAKRTWLEMGLMTVTFICYQRTDEKLVVEVYVVRIAMLSSG